MATDETGRKEGTSPSGAVPASTVTRAGRYLGVLGTGQIDRGFRFIRDAEDQEYFAHLSAFQDRRDFDGLADGSGVSFRVSETPKGLRAFDIRPATVIEQAAIDDQEDDRGNR